MSDTVIKVEILGKKYNISHQAPERYTALRDVIASKAKGITRNLLSPFNKNKSNPLKEEFWALKDVSFEIKQGEVIGIIGRNGAGKTTLLKILSRITEPSIGKFRLKGRVESLLEVGTGFHPELTGRENVFLNGAILGMTRQEIRNKFEEIVAFAEIEKFLDTPVKRYSSGMHVRLAFAIAAHLEPDILIVDEVLAVGDVAFQKKCLGKMGDVAKDGRTILFVSHNMSAIRKICRSAIWLNCGEIQKIGASADIVHDYEQSQVRQASEFSYASERAEGDIKGRDFYIKRLEMRGKNGEKTNIFSYKDSFVLNVEVYGQPIEDNYGLEFRIHKDSGEFAAVGTSGPLHGIYFNNRVKNVEIEIGPLILTNGRYNLSLYTISGRWIPTDAWENAGSFYIVGCHPFALPQEIKTPVCVIEHTFSAGGQHQT